MQVQTDMAAFTAKVNKEKKDDDKKLRKQSKTDFVEELKSQPLKYECYVCDAKLESFQKLKSHVKIYHFTNNSTQTQTKTIEEKSVQCSKLTSDKAKETCEEETVELEFEKYPCFYCDREIASELEALEHRVICHGATDTPSMFSFPVRLRPMLFKCVLCGLVASCKVDIVNQIEADLIFF